MIPPAFDVRVNDEPRPLPCSPPDGPQTPLQVLQLHEKMRQQAPGYDQAQRRMHISSTLLVHVCAGPPPARPPKAPPPPLRPRPQLALLIASHTSSRSRLERLRSTLASVAAQRFGAPSAGVWLSWSAEDEFRAEVRAVLAACDVPRLHSFEQPRPCRQFEHYAELCARASHALGGEAWAAFADDDDLLHPDRSAAYEGAIRAVAADVGGVSAAWIARPRRAERAASAADVDRLVRTGRAARTPEVDASGARVSNAEDWDEYFNHAIRLSALSAFFAQACPPLVRASKYADMVLHTYLRNAVLSVRFEPQSFESNWCYYYDKPLELGDAAAQGNASSGAEVGEDDEAEAEELRTAFGGLLAGVGESRRRHLAAQFRCVLELYCTGFAGAPKPPPRDAFIQLGQLVTLDHLEALGWDANLANALGSRIARRLARVARAFGVRTTPPLPEVGGAARAAASTGRGAR